MPVIGHDPARCRRRNALAARKGLNAVPVRLLAKAPPPIDTNDPATEKGLRVITARGTLPRTPEAAVERINKLLGEDAEPLTADQVWIVYCEAGNANYISKYCMFLGDSTLRGIARRGERSMAFMNSHRTGGMSTPAELPYGRTFAGRFEQTITPDGRQFSRTLLGVYMVRGQRPNGSGGPSTDELYAGIKAGTIFDVSLGIQGGEEVCDVCGYPLGMYGDDDPDEPLCPHIPGTHHAMTDEEIKTSAARGVPEGVCSFTLEDATAGEVSPVFDGAVPGAGFRKALRAARARHLSASSLAEARRSFGPLARRRDFSPDPEPPDRGRPAPNPRGPAMSNKPRKTVSATALRRLAQELNIDIEDDDATEPAPAPVTAARPASNPPAAAAAHTPAERPAADDTDGRLRALEEQNRLLSQTLDDERKARQTEGKEQRRAAVLAQAANWADAQVRLGAAIPAERDELVSLYAQAATDDHEHPAQVSFRDATNTPRAGTRVQALAAVWAKRGRHDFATEHVAGREAPDSGGNHATGGPIVDLALLAHQPKADPITDQMLAGNARFHGQPGANGAR